MPAVGQGAPGKVDDLVVVETADDDHVELDGLQTGGPGCLDAGPDVLEPVAAGDAGEALGPQGIEADVDALQTGPGQVAGVVGQEGAVGRHRQVVDAGNGRDHAHEIGQAQPGEGLAAGEPHLADAQLGGGANDEGQLFVAQDLAMVVLVNALGRHAVDAAQVAAVGDRYAQVVDGPAEIVAVWHRR